MKKFLSCLIISALLFSCSDNDADENMKSEIPDCNDGYTERISDEENLNRLNEFSSFVDSWEEPNSYTFSYEVIGSGHIDVERISEKITSNPVSVCIKDGKLSALKSGNFTLNFRKEWEAENSIEYAEKNYFTRIRDLLENVRKDWNDYSEQPYYEVNISAVYDTFCDVKLPCIIKGDDEHPYQDYLFEIRITDFKLDTEFPDDFDYDWRQLDGYTYAESDDANKSRFEEFSAFVDSWEEPSSYTFSYLATDLWKFPNCSEKSFVEGEPVVVSIRNGEVVDFQSPYDDDWSDEKQRGHIKEEYYMSIEELLWRLRYDWRTYTAHPYENVTIAASYDDVGGKKVFAGIFSEDLNSDSEFGWYDFSIKITDFKILDE